MLNRERQFVDFAPEFRKPDPNEGKPILPSVQKHASTMPTQVSSAKTRSTRDSRFSRWDPKTISSKYDDLNDRDQTFDLGVYESRNNDMAAGMAQKQIAYSTPYRQAVSAVRPGAPRTQLISSAKMQIGKQPSATLHSLVSPYGNPLVGYS